MNVCRLPTDWQFTLTLVTVRNNNIAVFISVYCTHNYNECLIINVEMGHMHN